MSIIDVLNAIKTAINTKLPELRRCELHGGRFDLAELKRIATQAPAVFVSLLALPDLKTVGTGESDIELTVAVYVVTADKVNLPRAVSVINITQALLLLITNNDWGITKIKAPTGLNAQNLYSGDVDKTGIALYAISFKQTVRLGTDIWLEDGTLPSTVYLGQSPDIGLGHEDDYWQIAP